MPRAADERRTFTEVRLTNFKSAISQRVGLKPLTVVVGANSSGKSTLLQAIMAMAQAVQASGTRASFPLNGHLTDLGYFDQVRHAVADTRVNVGLGISLSFVPGVHAGPFGGLDTAWRTLEQRMSERWGADYDVEFRAPDPDDPIAALMQSVSLNVTAEGMTARIEAKRSRARTDDGSPGLFPNFRGRPEGAFHSRLRGLMQVDGEVTKITGTGLRGSIPTFAAVRIDQRKAMAELLLRMMTEPYYRGAPLEVEVSEHETWQQVARMPQVRELIATSIIALDDWQRLDDLDRSILAYVRRSVSPEMVSLFNQEKVVAHRDKIVRAISRGLEFKGAVNVVLAGRQAAILQIAESALSRALGDVRHLGGLRIAPQPLYPTSAAAQQGELGKSGQYTAAVLYSLRRRNVMSFDDEGHEEMISLETAVERWAQRLKLFSDVKPHHQGALGIDIQVTQPGLDKELDITAVGLGVSQMLPVLLRCLLSGPDEVVLLEQPELHLHPASQQRLADFLLACTRSGRQIIVETHSEHLINRLRLRAAEDGADSVPDLVGLVFAERDDASGETSYRNVELNPYGGLSDWPAGFLAEGIADAQVILERGLAKVASRHASPDVVSELAGAPDASE